jgi:hypothetical protein
MNERRAIIVIVIAIYVIFLFLSAWPSFKNKGNSEEDHTLPKNSTQIELRSTNSKLFKDNFMGNYQGIWRSSLKLPENIQNFNARSGKIKYIVKIKM